MGGACVGGATWRSMGRDYRGQLERWSSHVHTPAFLSSGDRTLPEDSEKIRSDSSNNMQTCPLENWTQEGWDLVMCTVDTLPVVTRRIRQVWETTLRKQSLTKMCVWGHLPVTNHNALQRLSSTVQHKASKKPEVMVEYDFPSVRKIKVDNCSPKTNLKCSSCSKCHFSLKQAARNPRH